MKLREEYYNRDANLLLRQEGVVYTSSFIVLMYNVKVLHLHIFLKIAQYRS